MTSARTKRVGVTRAKPATNPGRKSAAAPRWTGRGALSITPATNGSRAFPVPPVAQVAQLVEHVTENHGVGGSIPPLGTTNHLKSQTYFRSQRRRRLYDTAVDTWWTQNFSRAPRPLLNFPWPWPLKLLPPAYSLGVDAALRREAKPRGKGCLHAHRLLPEHDLAGGMRRVPCDQRRLNITRQQREIGFNKVTRIAGTNQFLEQRTLVIVQVWRRLKPGWLAVNGR
jgi:hypothetical protein